MSDYYCNKILQKFLNQCLKFPNNTYLVDEEGEHSFSNVLCTAYSLSKSINLRNNNKSCKNKPIAIILPRGISCVSAFYAAWMTSNFYVPIDPEWPEERIIHILSELNPIAIIYDENISKNLIISQIFEKKAINISDILLESIVDIKNLIEDLGQYSRPEDPCYCIYTSGSTGKPKGVLISHRSLFNYIQWFVNEFELDSTSRFGNMSQLYFDISAVDIYVPTFTGGSTYFIPSRKIKFPIELLNYIANKSINSLMWVPSALTNIASTNSLLKCDLPYLKNVFFAGEPLPVKILSLWQQKLPSVRFVNMYGPTEATITSTHYEVPKNFQLTSIPIGKCSQPSRLYLLQGLGQDDDTVKIAINAGEIGEICIGGEGVGIGYWRNSSETVDKFIYNPLNIDYLERIYRTGDLGKYDDDENLIFCGRIDSQIKHHGYRIELGEIEIAVEELSEIYNSCALYIPQKSLLVLAIETSSESLDTSSVSSFLKNKLPHYMVPSIIKIFIKFPLLSTGKVDRKSIREMF